MEERFRRKAAVLGEAAAGTPAVDRKDQWLGIFPATARLKVYVGAPTTEENCPSQEI